MLESSLLPNAAAYLTPLSALDRARHYPYRAPTGGYVLSHGRLLPLDQAGLDNAGDSLLDGRVPVLSVGSNRAPVQLLRKFGDAAVVPVTPARLHDCDVVHTAYIGYYAAVPCTAFPAAGTVVALNVAWLDPAQLVQMHRTEGIGVAYDFVEMQGVEHLLTVPEMPVFGYAARFGALDCGDGKPAGLAAIPAAGRQFKTLDQHEAANLVRQLGGADDARPMPDFIADMQRDKPARDRIVARLARHALFAQDPPWQVIPVSIDDIDAYL
jgi:hypothetical protein